MIGGSYFLGRVFVMAAAQRKDIQLSVLNRGNYPLNMENVTELRADRKNPEALRRLKEEYYDTIVDFCGYEFEDIRKVFNFIPGGFRQYLFISTVDVYKRGINGFKDEHTAYEDKHYAGENGEYIWKKIHLEKELVMCCEEKGCSYTIVRPALLYGPFNYALREKIYMDAIFSGKSIPYPSDADGAFQMVYVKDAAEMILALCGNEDAYQQSYNLCPEEVTGYGEFLRVLKKVSDYPVSVNYYPVKEMLEQKMLLPFPVTQEETELYDGKKLQKMTGISFLPLEEGMRRTYTVLKPR